jgi:hypothetical protein
MMATRLRQVARRGALFCPLLAIVACGDRTPVPNDAPAAAAARAAAGTDTAPQSASPRSDSAEQRRADSILAAMAACPRTGLWRPCSLEHRLQLAGLRPVRLDTVPEAEARIPGLDAPTVVWRTGSRTIRVAFFADSAAARAAFAGLDSAAAAPRGGAIPAWPAPPTVFRGANAVVLLVGGSARQIERLSDAVHAGPPQPK